MTKNYGAPNVSTVEAEKALSVGVGGVIAEQCRGGGGGRDQDREIYMVPAPCRRPALGESGCCPTPTNLTCGGEGRGSSLRYFSSPTFPTEFRGTKATSQGKLYAEKTATICAHVNRCTDTNCCGANS